MFIKSFSRLIFPIFIFTITLSGCGKETKDYYELSDYNNVQKIDAHIHINSSDPVWIELAREDNFKLLSINVDYPDFVPVEEQLNVAINHRNNNPEVFAFASTFYMAGWDDSEWLNTTFGYLDSTFNQGAIAVKVWKNIGMGFRNKDSNLVMIDDSRFDPVFEYLRKKDIPLIGHHGEPKDCWLPVEKMINNDMKLYFGNHPHYHMYLHPDMPSYEDQMAARDRMLSNNPETRYMGAHVGSLEWSLDKLQEFFDKYPNATVDLSARMGYMQYHSAIDREKTREFFIKYQDRIIYATDNVQDPGADPAVFKEAAHDKWLSDWMFMVTDSTMDSKDLDLPFKGLALPKIVIDKVYRLNAEKLFTKAWKK
ncbi:MAG: amidohydrolase family protein [Ignavibacteriaceae bacterium]